MFNINFANDWIQTAGLWCWKQTLWQLSYNHCPNLHICLSFTICQHLLGLMLITIDLKNCQLKRFIFETDIFYLRGFVWLKTNIISVYWKYSWLPTTYQFLLLLFSESIVIVFVCVALPVFVFVFKVVCRQWLALKLLLLVFTVVIENNDHRRCGYSCFICTLSSFEPPTLELWDFHVNHCDAQTLFSLNPL